MQQSNVIVHMHYTDFRPSYNLIFRTSIQQILPTAVNLLLILNEKVLVLRLEQVLEPALRSQEVLDRKLLLRRVGEDPFALDNLEQRPVTCLDCQLADVHDLLCRVSPSSRTW